MRLTDQELTALLRWGDGKPDTECLSISFRELRGMVEEIRERRAADDVRSQVADEDLILDEDMPEPGA